jgi:fucose permease
LSILGLIFGLLYAKIFEVMATLFLIIVFLLYIGLGVPDSSFGTAIPAMWAELNLPLSLASVVSLVISVGTTISAFFSFKLTNKFGTGIVVAISTFTTALTLLGFSLTNSFYFTLLLAFPLGLGAGAIDSAINGFIASHYSSSVMSFLHCFYGIGVFITPFLFSFTLKNNNDWRLGYEFIFYIQLALGILSLVAIPMWKKVANAKLKLNEEIIPLNLSYKRMAKSSPVRFMWIAFFSTCALEFTCDVWGTSFLVSLGMSESLSARFISFYFVGITLSRIISGILNAKFPFKNVIAIGYFVMAIGVITLFLPLSPLLKGVAIFLIGLGNGQTFPNLTFSAPYFFGKNAVPALISSQMVASNLGILIIPPLFGVVAQKFSVKLFPYFLIVLLVFLILSTLIYFKKPKTDFNDLQNN